MRLNKLNQKRIMLGLFCLLYLDISFAVRVVNNETQNNSATLFNLQGIYVYRDFKFDSSRLQNYNRFQGYSNVYVLGGNNFKFKEGLTGGLFISTADLSLVSRVSLNPVPLIETNQSIHNNSIFGHVTKSIQTHIYLDVSGGYGQNSLQYATTMAPNTIDQQVSSAKNQSNNWFVSATTFYSTIWRKLILTGSLGYLYNQMKQDSFNYIFKPALVNNFVAPLTNKSSYLLENAEIGYQVNPIVEPFINGGLIQVLQFSNSTVQALPALIGASPEFYLNQNGFLAGAGLSLKWKQVVLRAEQQYVQRANVYHSNVSIVSLKIAID